MKKQKTKVDSGRYFSALPFVVALLLIFSVDVKSQNKGEVYNIVEEMPAYPGGDKAMFEFISNNLKYPKSAQGAGTQGRVIVRFVVAKTGEIENVVVLRGFDKACDEEAARVVKMMPKWTPGKQGGENVAVNYTIPIVFKIPPKEVSTRE